MLILAQRQVFSWSGRSCLFSVPGTFRIILCKSQGDTNKHFRHRSWNLHRRKNLHGFQLVIKNKGVYLSSYRWPLFHPRLFKDPRIFSWVFHIFIPNSPVAWRVKMWRLPVVPTPHWELSKITHCWLNVLFLCFPQVKPVPGDEVVLQIGSPCSPFPLYLALSCAEETTIGVKCPGVLTWSWVAK